jgi:hypothetical protein
MSEKAQRREEEEVKQRDPEAEEAREAEEERGGHKDLHDAVQRIREAVARREPPHPEDIQLAQRYLGNARVAALLQGLDPEQDAKRKEDDENSETPGRFRLAIYVRKAEVRGAFDPGQCMIGLQGPTGEQLYGFHPGQAFGPAHFRGEGVNGQVLTDPSQLDGAHKTQELEITREQLEVIRAHAESLRAKPPSFDFDRWNSMSFVADLLGQAGVELPTGTFTGMATPQSLKGDGRETAEPEVDSEDDADGGDGGDGDDDIDGPDEVGDGRGAGGKPPPPGDKPTEGGDDKKKPGFFGRIFGAGGKTDKGDKEGGGT